MKVELEKLCEDYIANREAVRAAFRWDNSALVSVCANIFCANGQTADTERLKECLKVVKSRTGLFSAFRNKKIRSLLSSMLAIGENPEERMALADEYYRLLRRYFKGTEYLVLTAILLADLLGKSVTAEEAARGKELFRRMNKKHRILTNNMDSVFSMLMAFSEKTDDELTEDTEACYRALNARFSGGGAQTAAQILSTAPGTPEEKTQRVTALYDALLEAKVKYGRSGEPAVLAALSLADTPVPVLAEEIRDADEFLGAQKNLYGSKEEDLRQRSMHAAMIVSDRYAGTDSVNVTVMAATLEMLISRQQASRISIALQLLQGLAKLIPTSGKTKETGTEEPQESAGAGDRQE